MQSSRLGNFDCAVHERPLNRIAKINREYILFDLPCIDVHPNTRRVVVRCLLPGYSNCPSIWWETWVHNSSWGDIRQHMASDRKIRPKCCTHQGNYPSLYIERVKVSCGLASVQPGCRWHSVHPQKSATFNDYWVSIVRYRSFILPIWAARVLVVNQLPRNTELLSHWTPVIKPATAPPEAPATDPPSAVSCQPPVAKAVPPAANPPACSHPATRPPV